MRVVYKQFPQEWTKVYILPISDIHYGSRLCDIDKLKRYLAWAMSLDNVYFLLNGDLADCATISSVRNVYEQKISPQEQLDFLLEFLEPYSHRIIAMTTGNHEDKIWRESGIDISKIIADKFSIPYEPEGIIIKIHIGKLGNRQNRQVPYTIYMTHGWSAARGIGGKANALRTLNNIVVNADVYIASHTHQLLAFPDIVYYVDEKKNTVIPKKRYYVNSGSYQSYGGYAQKKGYTPVKLGTTRIRLDGTKRDVHISL